MKLLRIAALALGVLAVASVASANTIWNFDNVSFNRPGFGTNTITGSFTLNAGPSDLVSWDFTVSGTNAQANHHYISSGAPEGAFFISALNIDFFNFGVGVYTNLYFASALTNAGGTVNLVDGTANGSIVCPGCGTLVSGSLTTLDVNGTAVSAVPEPATLVLCGIGAMFVAGRLRRRQ